jgi:hypothetical protein
MTRAMPLWQAPASPFLKAWFDHGWELQNNGARIVFESNAMGTALNV